jgi:rhamnogalacturonan endolyase
MTFSNDTVEILAKKGFTMWWNERLSGDVEISYKACVMDEGLDGDRLSDLNCFWMAHDPQYPDDLFKQAAWRGGIFGRYYSLKLYYIGYGGNSNTTTRFRKYNGAYHAFEKEQLRPDVLKEYTDSAHLLKPNSWYDIRIVCKGDRTQYYMDGELLVDYTDNEPYHSGWFGFRTTESRIKLTQFKIKRGD